MDLFLMVASVCVKREEWGGRVGWLLGILGDELGPPADMVFRKRTLTVVGVVGYW